MKRIHFIAIGGAAMHNLAIALHLKGFNITGSDDEIFDPSRSRLEKHGLLPLEMGWFPERIKGTLDAVILGMHARPDNPELAEAKKQGIPIYSYPEFVFQEAQNQKRVAVCGSHGKTTTTSMIMHLLLNNKREFDYLVGASLDGFENMVQLSDAPVIILEGDEYLSSPIDRRPKFLHYKADICILTGIAWDHINVFPTFVEYVHQFELLLESLAPNARLIYFQDDEHIQKIVRHARADIQLIPYSTPAYSIENGKWIFNKKVPLEIFGEHNLQNFNAAALCGKLLGLSQTEIDTAMSSFAGARRRLQPLGGNEDCDVFLDFAHSPSKVKATSNAVKKRFPERKVTAILELHTFSSLNKDFIKEYKHTLEAVDEAIVFFSKHTLEMKRLPDLSLDFVHDVFDHPHLNVLTEKEDLAAYFKAFDTQNATLLLMSSGNFRGLDVLALIGI